MWLFRIYFECLDITFLLLHKKNNPYHLLLNLSLNNLHFLTHLGIVNPTSFNRFEITQFLLSPFSSLRQNLTHESLFLFPHWVLWRSWLLWWSLLLQFLLQVFVSKIFRDKSLFSPFVFFMTKWILEKIFAERAKIRILFRNQFI